MANEHWFDTLNKLLTHDAPRRGVLSTIAALTIGQHLGAIDAAAGKKGGKGGKNNGKGNKSNSNGKKKGKKTKKPKPPPAATCSEGVCNREFVLPDNREWCEFVCRQCDGDDPRDFCIVWAAPSDPDNDTKIADCCEYGEKCCGATCCPEARVCCGGDSCCQEGHTCCDGDCCPTNNPYTTCCDERCVITEYSQDHCGACGNPCTANEVCRLGQCECIDDCGEDECLNCPPGQFCHDGINCSCGNGFKYCPIGERCIREEWACCGGPQSVTGYCFHEDDCCGSGVDAYCRPSTTPQCP